MTTMVTDGTLIRVAATAAASGLIGVALFQLALALGAPLGRAAFGGFHPGTLPTGLRVTSAVAIVIWTAAATVVLRRGGLGLAAIPDAVAHWGIWILFGLLLLGTAMNVASSSAWERWFWGPYTLILAGLCYLVASAG